MRREAMEKKHPMKESDEFNEIYSHIIQLDDSQKEKSVGDQVN